MWLRRCVSRFLGGWIHSEQDDDDVDLCENEYAAILAALRVDTTKASSSSWTRMPAHHHEERWVVIRPWNNKLFARRAIRRVVVVATGDTIRQNYVVRITRTHAQPVRSEPDVQLQI